MIYLVAALHGVPNNFIQKNSEKHLQCGKILLLYYSVRI